MSNHWKRPVSRSRHRGHVSAAEIARGCPVAVPAGCGGPAPHAADACAVCACTPPCVGAGPRPAAIGSCDDDEGKFGGRPGGVDGGGLPATSAGGFPAAPAGGFPAASPPFCPVPGEAGGFPAASPPFPPCDAIAGCARGFPGAPPRPASLGATGFTRQPTHTRANVHTSAKCARASAACA